MSQHADNPVHWWPWCDAAFEAARAENKPVLLSIGYSACHWCHVMAHESFEDTETAAQMNRDFISIKVDREEFPDVDAIYQEALALIGVQGGWPLTMFLTPSREPFWGGTYFPKTAHYGRPSFREVLGGLAQAWRDKPGDIERNRQALTDHLAGRHSADRSGAIEPESVVRAGRDLLRLVDGQNGGLKGAPKFPQAPVLNLFWTCWHATGDEAFLQAHNHALERICQGGIYDHLGGGFARYSVDEMWLVPHFEKMLYDNALLVEACTRAWQATRNPLFPQRVDETVSWLLREMTVEGGGFTAALDADSEGVEGRFYVWSNSEIDDLLGTDAALFNEIYGVTASGNWEGVNILNRLHENSAPSPEEQAILERCRRKLMAARNQRIRPGRDNKVLADWNGLMIAAITVAARVFGRPAWRQAAVQAFDFVCDNLKDEKGGLYHSWCDGQTRRRGLLDDYAGMMRAALLLAESAPPGEAKRLTTQASAWAELLTQDFADGAAGGFYQSSHDAGDLIVRPRHAHDGPTPSGNAVAAEAFHRLFLATGNTGARNRSLAVATAFAGEATQNPFAHAGLLSAYQMIGDSLEIVIIGTAREPAVETAIAAISQMALPAYGLLVSAGGSQLPEGHPAFGKSGTAGTVYVCRNGACLPPAGTPEEISDRLRPNAI